MNTQSTGFLVQIGETVFHMIVPSPKTLKRYAREMKAVECEGNALVALAANCSEDDDSGEMIERRSTANGARMLQAQEHLIEHTLRDWSNPKWPKKRPCNTETRLKLSPSIKARLADLVIQKTQTG